MLTKTKVLGLGTLERIALGTNTCPRQLKTTCSPPINFEVISDKSGYRSQHVRKDLAPSPLRLIASLVILARPLPWVISK